MPPTISHELTQARTAGLRHDARRAALALPHGERGLGIARTPGPSRTARAAGCCPC